MYTIGHVQNSAEDSAPNHNFRYTKQEWSPIQQSEEFEKRNGSPQLPFIFIREASRSQKRRGFKLGFSDEFSISLLFSFVIRAKVVGWGLSLRLTRLGILLDLSFSI